VKATQQIGRRFAGVPGCFCPGGFLSNVEGQTLLEATKRDQRNATHSQIAIFKLSFFIQDRRLAACRFPQPVASLGSSRLPPFDDESYIQDTLADHTAADPTEATGCMDGARPAMTIDYRAVGGSLLTAHCRLQRFTSPPHHARDWRI
jgi:hypothetical protein